MPYDKGSTWDQHCRVQMGRCLAGLGRLSEAIEQYYLAYIIAKSQDKDDALFALIGTLLDYSWPQPEEEQYRLHINMRGTYDLTTQNLRFQEALELANQAIKDHGESIEALRLRGKAKAKLGQLEMALEDYAAGFAMSCTLPLAYRQVSDEYARQRTLEEYAQLLDSTPDRKHEVDDVCQRAIAQYPNEQTKSVAHRIYATHLLTAGRLELSEEHARKACDDAPGSSLNCGTYGLVLDAANKFDAAADAYLTAIQADPLSYTIYFRLCKSLSRTEEGPQRGIEFVMVRMGQLYQTPVEHWSVEDYRAASYIFMMSTVFHAKKGAMDTSLKQLTLWKQSITMGAVSEKDVALQLVALQVILRKASECEVLAVAAHYAAELLGECHPRTLQTLRSVSTVLQAAGLPSRAEEVLRQYLDRCGGVCAQDTEECLGGQNQLVVLMRQQGRLEEAEELARTTIQAYSETLSPTHTLTLSAYSNLGRALREQGRHAEADPILRACAADRERILGPDHSDTLSSYIELAECLTGQGRMDEAADIYSKFVPRAESILGPTHAITLMAKASYAGLHFKRKQLEHTEALLLSILPDVKLVFGDEHPRTIDVLLMLGVSLSMQEKYTRAEPFLKDALNCALNTLGAEHTITQETIQVLVTFYDVTGNKKDAEELLRKALDALHETVDYSHLLAGSTAYSLARMYKDRKAYRDAAPLYKEAYSVALELWSESEDQANFVREYCELLFKVGNYDDIEEILGERLDMLRESVGSDHADTLEIMRGTSGFLIQQGKFAEAEQLAREALEIETRLRGEDTNEALILGNNLGLALMSQRKLDEADEVLEHCLELRRQQYGEAHRETIVATQNLALLRMLQHNQDEAERMMRNCLATSRRMLGEEAPETILTLTVIGGWLQNKREYSEAESMLREAVTLARRAGHDSDLVLSQCLVGLAHLMCETGKLQESEALVQEIMAIHEDVLPEDHYRTSGPPLIQGMILMRRNEHAKAADYLRTAVRICKEKLPQWFFAVGYSQSVYGECLYSLERFEEAEQLLGDGFEIIRAAQGMQHRRTQEAVERLVRLYEDWAKPEQAEKYRALLRHPPFATEKPTPNGSQP